MSATIPSSLRAGDSLSATWSDPEHPATNGWVLRLTLINGSARYQASAAASGADHLLTVTASTTAGWAAGTYGWVIDATLGAQRVTVAQGSVQVLADLAAATTLDTRSNLRKALDAAEAALATHGARAYLSSIEIGDRKQAFTSPSDFLSFISRLRFEVGREENVERRAQGLARRNRLLVRFGAR